MDPKLRVGAPLSPIALAVMLALTAVETVSSTPWLPIGVAEANHCAPSCDCVAPACDCDVPPCVCADCTCAYAPDEND